MRKELQQKRDNIIKQAWENNKRTTRKGEFVEMFSAPISIPSLYRIIARNRKPWEGVLELKKPAIKKKPTKKQIDNLVKLIRKG